MQRLKKLRRQINNGLRNISIPTDTIFSIVILLIILLSLSFNLFQKIAESRENYQVYLQEKEALNILVAENNELKRQLEYYDSVEYKLLYSRDNMNRIRSGEKLFTLSPNVVLFNYEPEPVELYEDIEPWEVWKKLLFEGVL